MKKKAIALFITTVMLLWTAAPSFAAAETREISANYSGITLYIDLKPVALLDANGNPVEPFIADGTTYLPVRAISEALGMEVVWEADTKSVRISEKSEAADDADKAPAVDEPASAAATTEKSATSTDDAAKDAAATEKVGETTADAAKDAAATDEKTDTEAPAPANDAAATEEDADAAEASEAPATAAAESFIGVKTLSATYSDIAIYVNDEEIVPKDAAGNAVEPFIAAGSTYLPVRAVAEALGLTVSWDGAAKAIYVGEQPEKADDDATTADNAAYAQYTAALEALAAVDSYTTEVSGDMSMTADGQKNDIKISGAVSMLMHSATDIEVAGKTTMVVSGQETVANSYYKDGVLYTEAAGEKIKMQMPLDEVIAQVEQNPALKMLSEDAVKEQSVDGNTLKFTLNGNKLTDASDSALGSLKGALGSAAVAYKVGDIACTVTLDDAGALKSVRTAFSMEATVGDVTAEISYDITQTYTQIGGVKITAPTDLASYKELSLETK